MMIFVHDYTSCFFSVTCKVCKVKHVIQTEPIEIMRYMSQIVPIGDCFPDMHEEVRFLIISGICWECYHESQAGQDVESDCDH